MNELKILVPVDGSDNSVRTASYAAKLAESYPSAIRVTLISVAKYEEPASFSQAAIDQYKEDKINSRKPLLEKAKAVFDAKNLPVQAEALAGDPAKAILDYAEQNNMDLIMMGSRGRGYIKGMFMGSVSHKVLSLSKIPVTIVK